MKIYIGSLNPAKIEAVRESLLGCSYFDGFELIGKNVDSEIRKQPFGHAEIERGARNRARNAKFGGDFGIGVESGLVSLPSTKQRFYDLCIASLYDGSIFYQGFSGGFEVPKSLVKLIVKDNLDLGEACQELSLAEDEKIGSRDGIVGILTNGIINRRAQVKQAVEMALTSFHRPDLYKRSGPEGI